MSAKLTQEQVDEKLKDFSEWKWDDSSGKLVSGFEFENFMQAVDFVNGIAEIAEDIGHHPDLLLSDYNHVTIFTSTHDAEGITEKDFELITAIEEEIS